MTDRDHFAAAALTGLLSNVERYQKGPLTEQAFEIADFMLRERERVTEPMPVLVSGSGSVTPVSHQKSDEKPVAWIAVFDGDDADGEFVWPNEGLAREWASSRPGVEIAPLYLRPQLTVTSAPATRSERVNLATANEFHAEIARLRLTDVERYALKEAADAYADNDDDQGSAEIADALRGLLDRLKS